MGKSSKKLRKVEEINTLSEDDSGTDNEMLPVETEDGAYHSGDSDDVSDEEDGDMEESEEDSEEDGVGDEEDGNMEESEEDSEEDGIEDEENGNMDESEEDSEEDGDGKHDDGAEMEELEKELSELRQEEQYLLSNLKRHKDEDLSKGQAVKNQKALWDKTLEFRFLLQKPFSSSNRLPQEPVRSSFCNSHDGVSEAYADLLVSSKNTLDSLMELQEALIEKNPSIAQVLDGNTGKPPKLTGNSRNLDEEADGDWLQISQMHSRIATFRDKSVDKWQRKTQVTTGAAAIKNKLHAFNQNISEQVAGYMRDPTRMIKGMQQRRSTIAIFGSAVVSEVDNTKEEEDAKVDGDPELLDDTEFYQQLLREFFETIDPASSETAFYALKRLQTKKRKIVDRRASKSRKIRYNVHEKITNFMAPQPMDLPPMAPKLFENLFGLKTSKTPAASVA